MKNVFASCSITTPLRSNTDTKERIDATPKEMIDARGATKYRPTPSLGWTKNIG